jgi:DNA gyrase subunit B (EC 5.99.1.3)
VHRDGKIFEQEYSKGKPKYNVKEIGNSSETGTYVHFKPDNTIFTVSEFVYETVASRLRELAFLNAGITLFLEDEREKNDDGSNLTDKFHSEGGLAEFVAYLDSAEKN